MLNPHRVIKFWARKDLSIIDQYIPSGTNSLLDPFCGSGTSGIVGVLRGIRYIVLSDINPVAIFISSVLLNKYLLNDQVYHRLLAICAEVEKKYYTISINGHKLTVSKVAWVTKFSCPKCGSLVDPRYYRDGKKRLVCPKCHKRFYPHQADYYVEEPFEIYAKENKKIKIFKDNEILESWKFMEESIKPEFWYPNGKFEYPNGKKFLQHPHRINEVPKLFYKRGLSAASELYAHIEDEWMKDPIQGDFLKLAFISAIFAATKMLPYSKTSGPSWKIHRYWIPHIRFERNFCDTFQNKLHTLINFKESIKEYVKNYDFRTIYSTTEDVPLINFLRRTLFIIRTDAKKLDLPYKFDTIIMDLPHFDEINYFELTYVWQLWLEGRLRDRRFTDYSYWKNEIVINPKIGKGINEYLNDLEEVFSKYSSMLNTNGRLVLILHHRKHTYVQRIVTRLRNNTRKIELIKQSISTPSSMKGILRKKNSFIYILLLHNN